jgi:TatD-related deoxyribonuclease
VVAYSVVAPYPVDLIAAERALGLEAAVELQERALDLAGAWVRDHRAVALGEVGRPHFEVPAPIASASTRVFRHALEVARDVGCPVVVHSADLDAGGLRELAAEASDAGVRPGNVVKHYARAPVDTASSSGIARSYLARREMVRGVLGEPAPWFLETDYLDDPARPGAVLDLATVPRRARQVAEDLQGSADRLWVPFAESIERVYGWRPEVGPGGRA